MTRPVHFCACGDHAFSPLTKGFVVLVSPEDAHQLAWRWQASVDKRSGYITVRRNKSRRGGAVLLARELLGLGHGVLADHANMDSTDNRRSNIRPATKSQNACNRRKARHSAAPFKGVRRLPSGSWSAVIKANGVRTYIGTYATAEEAAEAYSRVAQIAHGEFARVA